jgi:hypothetical protein
MDQDVVSAFPEVFASLADHTEIFGRVMTYWLLDEGTCFDSLSSLLGLCSNGRAPVVLDEGVFAAHASAQWVKAARRLLALTHHGPTLCRFCGLIAGMSRLGPVRLNLAGQMLDKAFNEYPQATFAFLETQTSTVAPDAAERAVYQQIHANARAWHEVLARLPKRKELVPGDADLQVLRSRKARINRKVMQMATERSVFAGIITHLNVAQGRKFVSHSPSGGSEVVEMAQSSHVVELPASELADPMRGLLERQHLLGNAR